jgi:aminopeptidase N
MLHPAFTLANPNRVRALIGMFATGNLKGFHRPDGAGYRLLPRRPSISTEEPAGRGPPAPAARRWRRYDASRQSLMQGELERIAGKEGLSKDTYEVVSKSLAG